MNALPDIFPLLSDGVSRHGAPWTDYEDHWIVWLRRERKLAAGAIASIVGRSVATVYARFRILDAKLYERVDWDAAEFARARELLEDRSMTIGDVAKALGRTETSLRSKFDYEGVKPRRMDRAPARPALGADDSARLASLLEEGVKTIDEMASLLGVDAALVRAAAPKLSFPRYRSKGECEAAAARKAAKKKARRLRLVEAGRVEKKRPFGGFDEAKLARARDLAARETITRVAALLHTDHRTLKAVAEREGIVFREAGRSARAMMGGPARAAIKLPAKPPAKPVVTKAELRDLAAKAVEGRTIQRIPAEAPSVHPAARPLALTKATPVVLLASPRVAPVALPAPPKGVVASRPAAPRSFASPPATSKTRDAGHEKALTLRAGMDDAIARFLAERGATRPVEDHGVEGVVKAIRARGYSVVRTGATLGGANKDSGFLIDGRISIANEVALRAFAEARAIRAP